MGKREALSPAPADQLRQSDIRQRLEGLRGMAWAYGVLHFTGYSASGASKRFSAPNASESGNSKIFYQYLRGDRAPAIGQRGKNRFDLVAAVEEDSRTKGVMQWLVHDLWRIFDPGTSLDDVLCFADKDSFPPALAGYVVPVDPLIESELSDRDRQNLALEIFDDYLAICAHVRLAASCGYKPPMAFPLLEYLTPQAGLLEPVFGYVQAPFLQMVRDFYVEDGEFPAAGVVPKQIDIEEAEALAHQNDWRYAPKEGK